MNIKLISFNLDNNNSKIKRIATNFYTNQVNKKIKITQSTRRSLKKLSEQNTTESMKNGNFKEANKFLMKNSNERKRCIATQ